MINRMIENIPKKEPSYKVAPFKLILYSYIKAMNIVFIAMVIFYY